MTAESAKTAAATGRLDVSFAVLVLATLLTWGLGEAHAAGPGAMAALLVIAFAKCRLVIHEFMGLRSVKLRWRMLVIGWLLLVLTLVALAYWKGMP